MGTIITVLIIAAVVLAAVKRIIHDNKKGKSFSCGGNCSCCKGRCH